MRAVVHIVDDDASFRTATKRLLELAGYSVLTYAAADQFLDQQPEELTRSCLLLDVHMPGLSGLELQSRLKALGSTVPIVFVSGLADNDISAKAIELGAHDFLTKPINSAQLLRSIKTAITRYEIDRPTMGRTMFSPRSAVFAAASIKNALNDVDAAFTAKTGVEIIASYAASSTLAKQIEHGAPADVFVSADTDWMDYAAARKAINEATRVNLLGNSLALIAPKDSKIDNVNICPGFDLAKLAGDGRIATGDVKSVPIGKYAKAALEKLGAWRAAEPNFAMAESVRAALTLVARAEAALGIVYSTDAKVEPGVKVVGTFPLDSHPAIIYQVAATKTAKQDSTAYLAFLRSTVGKNIFERYGFKFLVSGSP